MKKSLSFNFIVFFLLLNPFYIYAQKNTSTVQLTQKEQTYLEHKKIVTMCVDPMWKPIAAINDKGEHEGIAADMINLISQKTGVQINLIKTSAWQESIEFSKKKKCDILSFANKTPKRDKWLIFTDVILEEPNVLVGRTKHPIINNLSQIKNETIVLTKDTAIHEKTIKDFPNLEILSVKSEEEAIIWVKDKKADLTLNSLLITKFMIQKGEFSNLKILSKESIYVDYLRIGVQKNNLILRDILNKGIRAISKNEYDSIINKYVYIKMQDSFVNYKYIIYVFMIFICVIFIGIFWNYTLRKKVAQAIMLNKQQSEMLFQQSKQAELGNLIANISHQWRDSLTKISYINLTLRAKIAKKDVMSEEFLDKSTQEIEESIDFMSETMSHFLDYYKPSSKITQFNVYDSIKSAMLIVDTKIKNQNLDLTFEGNLETKLTGIKNEWMQVWINIIINAINASTKYDIEFPQIKINISANKITLQDNCGGIDTNILNDLNQEKYTGLGLKICKDILIKNEKILTVENIQNGVLFTITS